MRPLRRRPKQLDAVPTEFSMEGGSGSGPALRPRSGTAGGPRRDRPTGSAPEFTDDEGHVVTDYDLVEPDPAVRDLAQAIAARLAVPRPRIRSDARRGSGDVATLPYRGGSDEIDLDATIEMLAEKPVPDDEDILVRERVRARRSVVLAVDVSGSMRGERVRTAAATVGALASELERDTLAVIAFWSDAAVLLDLGRTIRPFDLLDRMLRIPARGLTNVAFPLELAARRLERVPERDARVILLSDCVHNAGPDPRPLAARLPRLDVLLDTSGEKDIELGRELARAGHGTLHTVRDFREIAPALSEVFRE